MKIFRPLWRDGAFLVPQQFQQQARWDAHVADTVSRMALAHPGVLRAEFDASALTLSRLNATRLIVRFADGTLIDTELADILPPVRDVSDVMQDSVEVMLALPLLSASGGNLDDGRERPPAPLARRAGDRPGAGGRRTQPVLRHALTLRSPPRKMQPSSSVAAATPGSGAHPAAAVAGGKPAGQRAGRAVTSPVTTLMDAS